MRLPRWASLLTGSMSITGLTGTNRDRLGSRQALVACRAADPFVVTKLGRVARSLPDARAIAEELPARSVS